MLYVKRNMNLSESSGILLCAQIEYQDFWYYLGYKVEKKTSVHCSMEQFFLQE